MQLLGTPIEWLLRIVLATILGSVIGYERHNRSKEAGVRTHAIVSMAAATLMVISKYGFMDLNTHYDPSRIASTIITGVSFLGAGIIFVKNESVQGLTTSAGIWATAGIGMCCGAGMHVVAVFSAILMILVQEVYSRSFYLDSPRSSMKLKVTIEANASTYTVISYLYKQGYQCSNIKVEPVDKDSKDWALFIDITTLKHTEPSELISQVEKLDHVKKAQLF